MGWAVGYDTTWQRWVGYGVPSICDHEGCEQRIDRGIAYVCGSDVMGGSEGCGLYFCDEHLGLNAYDPEVEDDGAVMLCQRCNDAEPPFEPTPDTDDWLRHLRDDGSWSTWRTENPESLREIRDELVRRHRADMTAKGSK